MRVGRVWVESPAARLYRRGAKAGGNHGHRPGGDISWLEELVMGRIQLQFEGRQWSPAFANRDNLRGGGGRVLVRFPRRVRFYGLRRERWSQSKVQDVPREDFSENLSLPLSSLPMHLAHKSRLRNLHRRRRRLSGPFQCLNVARSSKRGRKGSARDITAMSAGA